MGGLEGMNKPDLQLNLYDLISCSCWGTLVLRVGICNLFLERVDCVATWLSVAVWWQATESWVGRAWE